MNLAPILAALVLGADPVAFVAVAPGYPGTTGEAQASMDAFAAALGAQAGWPAGSIVAAYHEDMRRVCLAVAADVWPTGSSGSSQARMPVWATASTMADVDSFAAS